MNNLPTSYSNVVKTLTGKAPGTGGYTPPKPQPAQVVPDYAGEARKAYEDLLRQMKGLMAPSYTPPAPYFDIVGNYSKARQQAESAVTPLYTKKLNDFLEKQRIEKERKQADTALAQKQADEALQGALDASGLQRTRTGEDVATNLADIANKEGEFQQDSGTQFDQARQALAADTAQAGLTTSGLGAQQQEQQQTDRNTTEARQVADFNVKKKTQELFKTRTIEDLAKSDELNTKKTGEAKTANQLDLDRYIQDQALQEKSTRAQLDYERTGDILNQTSNYEKLAYRDFLASLGKNTGAIQRANQTYGGYYG